MIKKLLNILGSRSFAITLMVLATTVIIVTNLFPNPLLMDGAETARFEAERPLLFSLSKSLNVMQITRHPLFLIIPFFVFSSITVCTVKRMLSRRRGKKDGDKFTVFPGSRTVGLDSLDRAREVLEKRGYKVFKAAGGTEDLGLSAIKGRTGTLGSYLFHAGMNIVIAGAVISSFSLFNRALFLTEGFEIRPPEVLEDMTPGEIRAFPFEKMKLLSFDAIYSDDDFPLDYTARMETLDRKGRVSLRDVKVNEAITQSGYRFMLERYYYAPRFIVTERKSKRVVQDAFVNLMVGWDDLTDEFKISKTGLAIKARFFPDFVMKNNVPQSKTRNLNNPVFLLEFFNEGEKIGTGLLHLAKKMDFQEGRYTIEFKELRKFIKLSVARDGGLPFVKVGLLMLIIGLCIRFFLNEKRISIVVSRDETGLNGCIGGRASYFPALFEEELTAISSEIEGA